VKAIQIIFINPQICYNFADMKSKYIYSILISSKNAYENMVCANGLVRIQNNINTQYNEKFNQNPDHPDGRVSFL
jgi:hypothetical protein